MEESNSTEDWLWLDFNGDRRVSVEDASGWFIHLLFLPGDLAIDWLLAVPTLASFLDLGPASHGGVASKTVSILFWIAVLVICGTAWSKLRDIDRALTAWITRQGQAGLRLFRVQRRLLASWIGYQLQRRRQRNEQVVVAQLDLPQLESKVLSCYASLEEERTLAATDVGSILRVSTRKVQNALLTLVKYRLLQLVDGVDETVPAYQITQAGQVYLLERQR